MKNYINNNHNNHNDNNNKKKKNNIKKIKFKIRNKKIIKNNN